MGQIRLRACGMASSGAEAKKHDCDSLANRLSDKLVRSIIDAARGKGEGCSSDLM